MSRTTEPRDPTVEPPGYKPPTSAEELLERYAAGERYFVRAYLDQGDLSNEELAHSNLGESHLWGIRFSTTGLRHVRFDDSKVIECDFSSADLSSAVFWNADLGGAVFNGTWLREPDLRGALFANTVFSDVDLSLPRLGRLSPHRPDQHYRTSSVTTGTLAITAAAVQRLSGQARVEAQAGVSAFLKACGVEDSDIPWLRDEQPGLTLYFSTKVTPIDRFLIDATVFGTLGFGTDCEVVQFEQREDSAVVRLQGSDPGDLATVADALHERIWEFEDRAQTAALQRMDKVFQLNVMGAALGMMAGKIEKMELRVSEAAVERLGDLGEAHVQEKDKKSIRTPGQTVLAAVWEGGKRVMGKAFNKLLTGTVVDALPLDEGDE